MQNLPLNNFKSSDFGVHISGLVYPERQGFKV